MPVSVRARGDVAIIELNGEFTFGGGGLAQPLDLRGHHLSDLGQTLGRLLDQGVRKIVLDLEGVSFFDSAGLGELIACKKRTVQSGGDIRLLRPTGKVRDMLAMLSLTRIFQVFDDEAAVLASFDR
ncbi:MAG TPA: STAS domain-containing protein [Candidatus Polarisedimenticolia bacterium]|nr:STAS domain-containing protein [Candidatus Polarisedimenticolia bacterium]